MGGTVKSPPVRSPGQAGAEADQAVLAAAGDRVLHVAKVVLEGEADL